MEQCYVSGVIYTCNPYRPFVEAILVRDKKIQALGSNEQIKRQASKDAVITDLDGRFMMPGFTDSHCHLVKRGLTLKYVDLNGTTSLGECRAKISAAASGTPAGEWIIGFGWNENLWQEQRTPTRGDLDDITPDHPVMITRVCMHAVWVNSRALDLAGIKRETPQPQGGSIDMDGATGEPTGIIREARYLIEDCMAQPTLEQLAKAVRGAQQEAYGYGITSVHSHETTAFHEALKNLDEKGQLGLRVFSSFPVKEMDQAVEKGFLNGTGTDHLWYGHIKFFADGSLGAKTAYMHEPYENDTSCGLPFMPRDELARKVEQAHEKGYAAAIHAIGDRAVSNSLDAIISSKFRYAKKTIDRIEHIQLVKPSDLERFAEYGIAASVQPIFVPSDRDLAMRMWGERRCENAYAWKTILDKGIVTVFGSDSPIEPCNPLLGIHAAMTRKGKDNLPENGWFPKQKLTLGQCLNAFIVSPAQLSGRPERLGAMQPGRFADLVVFDENLFELEPDALLHTLPQMTIVGGEVVYKRAQ